MLTTRVMPPCADYSNARFISASSIAKLCPLINVFFDLTCYRAVQGNDSLFYISPGENCWSTRTTEHFLHTSPLPLLTAPATPVRLSRDTQRTLK